MSSKEQQQKFKNGSTTYFMSSLFFPPKIRDDITRLYAFVRKADDFVDAIPQQTDAFTTFRENYTQAVQNKRKGLAHWQSGDLIVDDFVLLAETYAFDPLWAEAFLDAMQADLSKTTYYTIEETLSYMYGSAEVVGLFLCQLLHLPKEAHHSAKMLGRAMQYINFIRDINEDISLGRQYIPVSDVDACGLPMLTETTARHAIKQFENLIHKQVERYQQWQKEAIKGYAFIPKQYRIAVKTAADMYWWTSKTIAKNPLIVFEKKVKPSKSRIIFQALLNMIIA